VNPSAPYGAGGFLFFKPDKVIITTFPQAVLTAEFQVRPFVPLRRIKAFHTDCGLYMP
jgi:hypothetical protein